MKKCKECYPEIDYKCQKHRPENLCIGCNRTNQKLNKEIKLRNGVEVSFAIVILLMVNVSVKLQKGD